MNELELKSLRQELEAERERLRQHLHPPSPGAGAGNGIQDNLDRTDLADEYAERERDTALYAIEREQLQQIEAALARMDAGTYGICMQCGEPIAPARLEVLPYATYCIRCQSSRGHR